MRNRVIALLAGALFLTQWVQAASNPKLPPPATDKERNASHQKGGEGDPGFYSRNKAQKEIALIDPDGEEQEKKPAARATKEKDSPPKEKGPGGIDLPSTTPDDDTGGQLAMPEITQKAALSRSDVNRVVCREPIKDVFYSEEKGVKVKFSGNSAFVKFRIDKAGDDLRYSTTPTELFIVCGGNTYNLIAIPRPIPAQTIRLENGRAGKARENAALFRDLPLEKKILELIRRAYTDDLPESFTVTSENRPVPLFRDLTCILRRFITVDGEGLTLKEYAVTPSVDGMELAERDFLRREIAGHPIALSFDRPRVGKGDTARLFVVEMKALESSAEGGGDVR